MLQALGAAMDPWLLKRYLRFSLNRDMIKAQDVNTVIASVAANPHGHYLAWRHIKAYWPQIEILYMNESLSISDLILSVVPDYFITEYDYREVSKIFSSFFYIIISDNAWLFTVTLKLYFKMCHNAIVESYRNFFSGLRVFQETWSTQRWSHVAAKLRNSEVQHSLGKNKFKKRKRLAYRIFREQNRYELAQEASRTSCMFLSSYLYYCFIHLFFIILRILYAISIFKVSYTIKVSNSIFLRCSIP